MAYAEQILIAVPCEVSEGALLIASAFIGWLMSSMLLRGISHITLAWFWPQQKASLKAKIVDTADTQNVTRTLAPQVFDLFEHYGIFGAAPGAWSESARGQSETFRVPSEMIAEDCFDDGPDDGSDDGFDAVASPFVFSPKKNADATSKMERESHDVGKLFEQYALFGASLGSWSTSAPEPLEDLNGDFLPDDLSAVRAKSACGWSEPRGDDDLTQTEVDTSIESTEAARIFEHYQLFEAPIGAWRPIEKIEFASECGADLSDVSTDAISDEDWQLGAEEQDPEYFREEQSLDTVWSGQDSLRPILFETYSLFDAAPGTWTGISSRR